MQMHHIGFLELWRVGDVEARIGHVDVEEVLPREHEVAEYAPAFPQEMPVCGKVSLHADNRNAVGMLLGDEHLRFHSIIVQGFHEAVGCHGCASRTFACVYYQHSHIYGSYVSF